MNFFVRLRKMFQVQTVSTRESASTFSAPFPSKLNDWNWDGHLYEIRDSQFAKTYSDWRNAVAISDQKLKALDTTSVKNGLLSRNGYVREFSLNSLIAQRDYATLDLVIGRMNDYVDKNRRLATTAAIEWLNRAEVSTIIQHLPAIFGLKNQSRAKAAPVVEIASSRLTEQTNRDTLLAGITNRNHKISAICWSLANQLLEWSSFDRICFAIMSKNAVINQSVCCEVKNLTADELISFVPKLDKVSNMQLRREILLQTLRLEVIDEITCIKIALRDKSYGIRWMGRLWAQKLPDFLFAEYRNLLARGDSIHEMSVAIEGLCELNNPNGIPLCRQLLDHSHIRIRKKSLESLCQLDRVNAKTYLDYCLMDLDCRISKTCFTISTRESVLFDIETIRQRCQLNEFDQNFYLELLHYAGRILGWKGLEYASLISLANAETKESLRSELHQFLRIWSLSQIYESITEQRFRALQSWLNNEELNAFGESGKRIHFIFRNIENRWKT